MIFKNNVILLGKGSVSSSRYNDNVIRFAMKEEGYITLKIMTLGNRHVAYGKPKILSYSDDCYLLEFGKIERRKDLMYVP